MRIYRGVAHILMTVDQPRQRTAYLQMAATKNGFRNLADQFKRIPVDSAWTTDWAEWSPVSFCREIRTGAPVYGLAWGALDEKPVLVSAGPSSDDPDHGSLQVWDPVTRQRVGGSLDIEHGWAFSVAVGKLNGRLLAASADGGGYVEVWDLSRFECLTKFEAHRGAARAVALGWIEGMAVLASAGADDKLWFWDLDKRETIGGEIHVEGVVSLTIATLDDGTSVVCVIREGGDVCAWDFKSRLPVDIFQNQRGVHKGIAACRVNDQLMILFQSNRGYAEVWDVTTQSFSRRASIADPLGFGSAIGRPRGDLKVASPAECSIRLWDLEADQDNAVSTTDFDVLSLALSTVDSKPVVICRSPETFSTQRVSDGKVLARWRSHLNCRVAASTVVNVTNQSSVLVTADWDGALWTCNLDGTNHQQLCRLDQEIWVVAATQVDDRTVVIAAGEGNQIYIWEPNTRETMCPLFTVSGSGVPTLATTNLEGRTVVVCASGLPDAVILEVWDIRARTCLSRSANPVRESIFAISAGEFFDTPLIVTGCNGSLRLWHLAKSEPIGEALLGHVGWVRAVSVGSLAGETVIVSGGEDGTIRLWWLDNHFCARRLETIEIGAEVADVALAESTLR